MCVRACVHACMRACMRACVRVCVCNLFKVGKIYKDSKLYLQDIQSLIKTDDTDIKGINVTVVRNKVKVKTNRNTVYNFLQITHLQLTLSQFLITILKVS